MLGVIIKKVYFQIISHYSSFNLNNHILLNTSPHRGYAVNDANIQDFVSDLITKYIPSDLPQWQVIVIPASTKSSQNQEDNIETENEQVSIKNIIENIKDK